MKKSSTIGCKKRLFLLFSLFLVTFFPPSALGASAQNLSLTMRNASMKEIMQEIKRVSQYDFIVSDSDLAGVQRKTVSFSNATIDEVMSECLSGTGLTYTIDAATIVILKNSQRQPVRPTISGQVTDAGNRPIVGVTVIIKDTQNGVATDQNGAYRLNIPGGGEVTLVFSFLGMEPREILVPVSQNTLNVVMNESSQGIQEVVVTGIINKPRESYVGAVTTITEAELKQFQGRNLISTIANIDPSFRIMQNNQWGSDPNRVPDVQIRGTNNLPNLSAVNSEAGASVNAPLVIIDNFQSTLERMMDLDENEVTSITILKDGSATALYGSRGANGVIVITTKQPEPGRLRFTYQGTVNIEVPDLTEYDILNAKEKFELENIAGMYSVMNFTPDAQVYVDKYRSAVLRQIIEGVDTYWMSQPLRTGVGQTHNMKVDGGDDTFQYSISLQYKNTEGVMKKSSRDNINAGINLTYRHSSLLFRNHLTVGYNESKNSPYGNFSDYVRLNPYWKPYDEDGNVIKLFTPYEWYYWANGGLQHTNPLYNATLNTFDKSDYTEITNNFSIEWTPIKDLIFRGTFAITSNVNSADLFKPADHTDFADYQDADVFRKGSYDYSDGRIFNYSASFSALYNKVFAEKHNLNAALYMDLSQNRARTYTFRAEGFPDESIDFIAMAQQYAVDGSPSGSEQKFRRVGFLVNLLYGFDERFYADISYRLDGSSQYGKERRVAPFWSFGASWNVHREKFMQNVKFIDGLKIKFTYGITGSDTFNAYESQSRYRYYTDDNYKGWIGIYQANLGNPYLKWQMTDEYNAGIELSLFNSILKIDFDTYLYKTDNLRSSRELPYSNGFTSYTENIGKLENRGFDVKARVWLLRDTERSIYRSVNGGIHYNKDKITELSEAVKAESEKLEREYGALPNTIYREGNSQYTLYVVRSLGIDPSTGKELYLTRDGEVTYTWNANDRVAVGSTQPKYNGNLSSSFSYKDLTLSVSFGFLFGGIQYNSTLIDRVENANKYFNVDKRVLTDRWQKPGDRTAFRGLNENLPINYSSRFVQDNNVFSCQNINLRYTLRNTKWQKRIGLEAISFTASTGELFYWTSIKQERGTSYPFSRQFSLSTSIQF